MAGVQNHQCPYQDIGFKCILLTVSIILVYLCGKIVEYVLRRPRLNYKNKCVLITGCDTGFGRHLVQRLLGNKCQVIATCLTPEGVAEVSALGPNVDVIKMDVSNPESIQRAYRRSLELIPKEKGLWGIVNNAGIFGTLGPSDWLRRQDIQHCLDVNALGMIDVINAWLPLVQKANGRIVNMSSVLGRVAVPYATAYCVSKFAVQAYTSALRIELSQTRVSVHLIEPGAFRTNFTNASNIKMQSRLAWNRLSPDQRQEYGPDYVDNMVDAGMNMLDWTMSTRKDLVVRAYEHALFARYPKRRYIVGLDSTAYLILSYCPDWVSDIVYRFSGILTAKPKTQ